MPDAGKVVKRVGRTAGKIAGGVGDLASGAVRAVGGALPIGDTKRSRSRSKAGTTIESGTQSAPAKSESRPAATGAPMAKAPTTKRATAKGSMAKSSSTKTSTTKASGSKPAASRGAGTSRRSTAAKKRTTGG